MLRRSFWDPSTVDGHGTEGGAAPDGGILSPDHGVFQFDATAPADTANEWSGVAIDVDFVDDTFQFGDTTTHVPAALDWRITPDFDDDPGWIPGVVTQPSSDQTSRTTDAGIAPPDMSSQADPEIAAAQNVGPAGLDWRITPDFDDDPGWQPGVIFPPSPSADDDGLRPAALSQHDAGIEQVPDAGSVATGSADEPPLRDETQTTSLTLAELNEQYPGIVWPADWWLL